MVTERPSDGESLFFLSVGGDRNEGISFALERGGEIIAETSPMLDYAANTVRGDIEQPMIIDFINDLEISVYPNPFEHELNFMLNTKLRQLPTVTYITATMRQSTCRRVSIWRQSS